MNILVTGSNSGLGKYIHNSTGAIGLKRDTSEEEIEKIRKSPIDFIIHCAFNSQRDVDTDSVYDYLEDNILLTKQLVSFPHRKFIFISSVDVYPPNAAYHTEDEKIDIDSVKGIYGLTKLMSESIVRKCCRN